MTTVKTKVRDLQPGDKVDMEGDPFHRDEALVEFEYGVVEEVIHETPNCFVVVFENITAAAYSPDKEFDVVSDTEE